MNLKKIFELSKVLNELLHVIEGDPNGLITRTPSDIIPYINELLVKNFEENREFYDLF